MRRLKILILIFCITLSVPLGYFVWQTYRGLAQEEAATLRFFANTLFDEIERQGKGLIMFMGKGGVGKTTLAAALACELAERGHSVLLTTTDPAAHLSETLGQELAGLTLSRIDPDVETARYREHVLKTKGKALDAEARAMLEEDLRSPCTEVRYLAS